MLGAHWFRAIDQRPTCFYFFEIKKSKFQLQPKKKNAKKESFPCTFDLTMEAQQQQQPTCAEQELFDPALVAITCEPSCPDYTCLCMSIAKKNPKKPFSQENINLVCCAAAKLLNLGVKGEQVKFFVEKFVEYKGNQQETNRLLIEIWQIRMNILLEQGIVHDLATLPENQLKKLGSKDYYAAREFQKLHLSDADRAKLVPFDSEYFENIYLLAACSNAFNDCFARNKEVLFAIRKKYD